MLLSFFNCLTEIVKLAKGLDKNYRYALGNDGYFNPNDPVTRAQFVAFMSRAMKS